MRNREVLTMLEAAYELSSGGGGWIGALAATLAEAYGSPRTTYGYTATLDRNSRPVFHNACLPIATDPVALLAAAVSELTQEQLQSFYKPGTIRGGLADGLGPMAALGAVDSVHALHELFGGGRLVHVGGCDAGGRTIHVGVFVDGDAPGLESGAQERLGVHLHAAMRLRHSLGDVAALDAGEAVFEADGRLAHAKGGAITRRDALESAVRAVDASRAKAVRAPSGDPDLLDVWQGLLEGRWSLIDRIDSDGRRYYVALVNPPLGVPARALTANEAQAVAMAVVGEPNYMIAYALGVASSTVANWLHTAIRKLGVANRSELIRLGSALLMKPMDAAGSAGPRRG